MKLSARTVLKGKIVEGATAAYVRDVGGAIVTAPIENKAIDVLCVVACMTGSEMMGAVD